MRIARALRSGILLSPALFMAKIVFGQEAASSPQAMLATEIDTAKKLINMMVEFCVKYSFQVLGGIIILVLGWMIARAVTNFVGKGLEKKKIDAPVAKFILGMIKLVIMAFAALISLGKFGVTIAPFIAGLSVIGFGTSFALQGPLSNYAAGITLIFTKPFRVGDIVEVSGVMGEVQDMTLARTEVKTVDGTMIVVPNKQIIGEVIHNYGDYKKLDITVGVSYNTDMGQAINVVKEIVNREKRISKTPEPKVGISEFADSSINIYLRLWCKQIYYWDVMFDINKSISDEFVKNKIVIPFPQRDVHIVRDNRDRERDGTLSGLSS